ncbi:MAG: metalloregulator ArsR/SmtB family transcription factor [Acidobacteria bacterium]|jgi:DNA-binding transcriptional ArsR family regulator|nr:metalloregulator ArsR/SmtB family transcription factor [Acidobacteriota bacterium]
MKYSTLDSSVAAARALGHPARLRTVAMLASGELCVCQITEVLELAPSTVSAHLKELKQAGLIGERKDGRWVYIDLDDSEASRSWIEAALSPLSGDPQLESDRLLVEELRSLPVEDLCRHGYEAARKKAAGASPRRDTHDGCRE